MSALPSNYDLYHRRGVQKALNEKCNPSPNLKVDGVFGPVSVAALQTYQHQSGLDADGVYGPQTQALLEPFIASKYIAKSDLQQAANDLQVELFAIEANAETESQGSGFFNDGSCAILFERYWMYRNLIAAKGQATNDGLMNRYPDIINPSRNYLGGPAEYKRLNLALTVDRNCALLSTSWGLFQIMGFNYKDAGYQSVESYVSDMNTSEKLQLAAYVNFIKNHQNGALQRSLQAKNWAGFTGVYNGSANISIYSMRMSNNYKLFSTGQLV